MKVILLQDIKGSGKKNDIITVSDGYARNFLFPKRMAVEATQGAAKEIEKKRAATRQREIEQQAIAQAKAKELKDKVIIVKAKCGDKGRLYGSVTTQEIADALKAQHAVEIDKRKIDLRETVRSVGEVQVTVRIYPNITTNMIVRVTGDK